MKQRIIKLLSIFFLCIFFTSCTQNNINGDLLNPSYDTLSFEEEILKDMSLEEKIGQLFFLSFRKDDEGNGITSLNENTKNIIETYKIGGVILFSENIKEYNEVKSYIKDLKSISKVPLFIGIDEEGGRVIRTASLNFAKIPSANEIGNGNNLYSAYDAGSVIGSYLYDLGFNTDFAPVMDINTNPDNTVIGDRSFGDNLEIVSSMGTSFIDGLSENKIFSSVKHYPGHGDTYEDSHNGFASVSHDINRLREIELKPFKAGIDAGCQFVLAGHISVPNVTGNNEPAIFSSYLLTDILKDELGFGGIVITDALDMGAITNYYSSDITAVKSINAGIDMLLMPDDFNMAYNAVLTAARTGEISIKRLDDAVLRILKVKKNIWED